MSLNTYESFRRSIETKWLAGQRSGNVAAERLYERVLFRLVDQPGVALAHLGELAQSTRDPEVCAWYTAIIHELASLLELKEKQP
ncbi:MAG: hypothetical protein ACRDIV_17525 [Ktedonobacteraceae bacterium]